MDISVNIGVHLAFTVIAVLLAVNQRQIAQLIHEHRQSLRRAVFPELRLVQAKETVIIASPVRHLDRKLTDARRIQRDSLRRVGLLIIVAAVEKLSVTPDGDLKGSVALRVGTGA